MKRTALILVAAMLAAPVAMLAQTECSNLADRNNPNSVAIQNNLDAQVAKWTSNLNPLKTYPIVSARVAYSFHIR